MGKYDNPLRYENVTLNVEISNIRPHHAIALKQFLKHLHYAGAVGTSRHYAFFADGDGDFRPKINIESNIELPEIEDQMEFPEKEIWAHRISPYGKLWDELYGDKED
jgi:hypothetical protein